MEKRKIRKACYTVAIRFNVRTKPQAQELQKILLQTYELFVSKKVGTEWKLPKNITK